MKKQVQKIPQLRFPNFDDTWEKLKLGNLTSKIGSGSTPRGGSENYIDSGIPFIRSQNVNYNRLTLDETHIPKEIHEDMKGSTVFPDDILLNITGASIGRSCVVPDAIDEANVNQHVSIIRLNNGDPNFFQFFLSSHKGQKLIFQGATGSGREGINFKSISDFKFRIPSLPEQQKIASFLQQVDHKIDVLSQKITALETYKKGVMQKLFSQEIRFNKADGSAFPDWEEKRLGDVCSLQGGYAFKSKLFVKKGVPIIRISNISNENNYIDTDNLAYYNAFKINENYILKENDLIVAMSGATTGKSCIYNLKEHGYLNQRVGVFRPKNILLNNFLTQFVFSEEFLKQLNRVLVAGAQPNISSKDIESFNFLLPVKAEQTKIANYLSAIDDKINQTQQQLQETQTFKKGLLQQMFL